MSSCLKKQEILPLNFRDKNKEKRKRSEDDSGAMNTLIDGGPCFRAVPVSGGGNPVLHPEDPPSSVSSECQCLRGFEVGNRGKFLQRRREADGECELLTTIAK